MNRCHSIERFFCLFLISYVASGSSWVGANQLVPDSTLQIPMRDGKELPTDLYLPSPEARALPCILLRTPAGRQGASVKEFAELAKEGYVVAVQETRSVSDVSGKTFPFMSDAWGRLQDGYDTVEWLAQSPYTNGRIGTAGASAMGITQMLLAPTQPPHLVCQYILMAAASLYHDAIFPGGLLLKHQTEGWLNYYARDTGVQNYVSQRPFYNAFWKKLNALEMTHRVRVPGLFVAGWYDTFLSGTLSGFTARQNKGSEGARGTQKLVIGPWTHFWPSSHHFGDFEMPKAGIVPPIDISPKRWFDYYLKGLPNGIDQLPPVTYFVMGPFDGSASIGNVWRTADVWPVPAVQTPFYLTPDAQLQRDPSSIEGKVSYAYDPANPMPTLGGHNLFLESGPKDQRALEARKDILLFTTEKLKEDVEVTGPLAAVLFFSSDQCDTDIVVRLCDLYPDGRSILIAEGGCRLGVIKHETGIQSDHQLGEVIPVDVDLWATSFVFAKGHAIRLSVTSSTYPRYEKNLNVGLFGTNRGYCKVGKNTLHIGPQYPSRLVLPCVRAVGG